MILMTVIFILGSFTEPFRHFDLYSAINLTSNASTGELQAAIQQNCGMKGKISEKISKRAQRACFTFSSPDLKRVYDIFGQNGLDVRESNISERLSTTATTPLLRKMKSIRFTRHIPLALFYAGGRIEFKYYRYQTCNCDHENFIGFVCPKCKGQPSIIDSVSIPIEIPAGVEDNSIFEFDSFSDSNEYAMAGSLELQITMTQDPLFSRSGWDLIANVGLSRKEFYGGSTKKIILPDSSQILVTKSAGDNNFVIIHDKGFRLPGQNGRRGNLIVNFANSTD